MNNNTRISTTISPKHFALLKKLAKVHGTQQKVLELALETFDKNAHQDPVMSPVELFVLHTWKDKLSCVVYKDLFSNLLKNADLNECEEWYKANKMCMAFAIEFFYQRPFKELSLREILDGLVSLASVSNMFDRFTYSDDGDHYMIKIYHSLGLNGSKYILFTVENIFDFCGVKYKTSVSEKTLFVKVYKNEPGKKGVLSAHGTS